MDLFDKSFLGLEKAMDVRYKRHLTLAGNVANNDTPNYRAREVDFAGELKRAFDDDKSDAMKKTHTGHMDVGGENTSHLIYDNVGAVGADGNNVDLDIQMGKLGTNASAYQGAATLLQMKLRILRLVSRGQGGG